MTTPQSVIRTLSHHSERIQMSEQNARKNRHVSLSAPRYSRARPRRRFPTNPARCSSSPGRLAPAAQTRAGSPPNPFGARACLPGSLGATRPSGDHAARGLASPMGTTIAQICWTFRVYSVASLMWPLTTSIWQVTGRLAVRARAVNPHASTFSSLGQSDLKASHVVSLGHQILTYMCRIFHSK